MSLPQTPPGGGARRPHVHFTYVKTPTNAKWFAHLAGPAHWYTVHPKGKTKPCLHVMTGGELACERCEQGYDSEVCAYVPLWRESDGRPVMVIVHEYTREVVDQLRVHARVLIGRNEEKSDGVYIIHAPNPLPVFHTTLQEKMRPADLTETLLRVWGVADLVTWYRRTHGAVKAPEPKKSDGKPFSPMMKAAARKASQGNVTEDLDDLIGRIRKRAAALPEPSSNGKHDPPPKG